MAKFDKNLQKWAFGNEKWTFEDKENRHESMEDK